MWNPYVMCLKPAEFHTSHVSILKRQVRVKITKVELDFLKKINETTYPSRLIRKRQRAQKASGEREAGHRPSHRH